MNKLELFKNDENLYKFQFTMTSYEIIENENIFLKVKNEEFEKENINLRATKILSINDIEIKYIIENIQPLTRKDMFKLLEKAVYGDFGTINNPNDIFLDNLEVM